MRAVVTADIAPFQRELARGPAMARNFSAQVNREAQRALSTTPRLNETGYADAGGRAGRAFTDGVEREVQGGDVFGGIAQQARAAALAIGAAFGVKEAIQAADAWQNAANRLRLVSDSASEAAASQRALFALAQETRTAYTGTVDVFSRFAQATERMGVGQRDILEVTRAINQSLAISGSSAEAAQAALVQLGQGLASGALRGEELNSVLEQAPRLARAIADGLGVSVGALRELGAAGQLTSERVFGALQGQAAKIAEEFETLEPTIGQAFTQITNAAQRFIGETSNATGAGRALAGTLSEVADNFETVANAAAAALTVYGARTVGIFGAEAIAGVRRQIAAQDELRRSIVQTTFAENAHAQSVLQNAIADTQQTAKRIANLERVEQKIREAMALEKARLAALAADAARQNAVPIATLRPLGTRAVEREMAQRAATQDALNRSSRNLLLMERQLEQATERLAVENAALASAQRLETQATIGATAADARHTAGLVAQGAAARAGAVAMTALRGTMAFLGGPIGVAITAAAAGMWLITTRTTAAERAARLFADELDEVRKRATDAADQVERMTAGRRAARKLTITDDIKEAQRALRDLEMQFVQVAMAQAQVGNMGAGMASAHREYNATIAETTQAFLDSRISADQFRLAIAEAAERWPEFEQNAKRALDLADLLEAGRQGVQNLRDELAGLDGVRAPVTGGPQFGLALDEEVQRLARLREVGTATAEQYRRITDIVTSLRAALRHLNQVEQTPEVRAMAEEYERMIASLTKETRIEKDLRVNTTEAERELREFIQSAQGSVIRINVVRELGGTDKEYADAYDELVAKEAAITAEIQRRQSSRATDVRAVRALLDAQREVQDAMRVGLAIKPETRPILVPLEPVIIPGTWDAAFDELQRMADAVAQAQAEVDLAPVGTEQWREATTRLAEVREAALTTQAAVAGLAQGLSGSALTEFVQRWRDAAKGIGEVREEAERTGAQFRAFSNAARGVLQIADAFGEVDDSVRRSLDGLAGFLAGLADAREAWAGLGEGKGFGDFLGSAAGVSSLISMIGGAASLLSGLFQKSGPSPEQLAWERALKSNEEEIRGLRFDLRAFGESLSDMRQAERASVGLDQVLRRGSSLDYLFDVNVWRDRMGDALAEFGLTIFDLEAAADRYNITLIENGKISTAALRDLAEAARLTRERALQLGQTFSDLANLESIRADLLNLDAPADAWAAAIRVAERMLPERIADEITAFDINTAAGRDAAQAWIRRMLESAEAGSLFDMLSESNFASMDEFLQWLVMVEQPLDDFRTAVDEAAGSLRNIPTGFKLDLRRFEATMAELPRQIAQAPAYDPAFYTPPPGMWDRREPAATVVHREGDTYNVTVVGSDKTATQIFDEMKSEAHRRRLADAGTTARAWEALN